MHTWLCNHFSNGEHLTRLPGLHLYCPQHINANTLPMDGTMTACLFISSSPVSSALIGTSKQTYLLFGVLFPIIMLKLNNVRNNSVYCVMSVPDALKIYEQFEVFIGTMFIRLNSGQLAQGFVSFCLCIFAITLRQSNLLIVSMQFARTQRAHTHTHLEGHQVQNVYSGAQWSASHKQLT